MNTTGLLLVLFGLGLLVLELKVPSFGVLGIGGTISLLVGSIMMTRDTPGVAVGLSVILPVVFGLAAIVLFLGRLALRAQSRAPTTGVEALIGVQGRALHAFGPDMPGQIDVRGEIWRALSRQPVPAGARVRVVDVQGLTLDVEPVDSTHEGDAAWKA